jgi:hypothetical protein
MAALTTRLFSAAGLLAQLEGGSQVQYNPELRDSSAKGLRRSCEVGADLHFYEIFRNSQSLARQFAYMQFKFVLIWRN